MGHTPLAVVPTDTNAAQIKAVDTLVSTATFYLSDKIPEDWHNRIREAPWNARIVYKVQRAVSDLGGKRQFNHQMQQLGRTDLMIGDRIPNDPE